MIAGGATTGEHSLNENASRGGDARSVQWMLRELLAPFQGADRVSWTFSGGCTTGSFLSSLRLWVGTDTISRHHQPHGLRSFHRRCRFVERGSHVACAAHSCAG